MLRLSTFRLFNGSHSNAIVSLSLTRPNITSVKTFSMTAQQPDSGVSYTYNTQATGSPTTYSAINLPAGMNLNSSTGAITGAPFVAGTYTVNVSATNSFGTGSANITFTAATNNSVALPVLQSDIISATIGQSIGYSVVQTGGATAYVYSAANLPSGLVINTSTGQITGTPVAAATTTATVSATNARGTSTAQIMIVAGNFTGVNLPVYQGATTISRNEDATGYQTFSFSNSPTDYVIIGTPSGMSFTKDQTAAYLSSLYTGSDASSSFTIAAINAGGIGKALISITWVAVAPVLANIGTVASRAGYSFSYQPTATGKRIVYSAANLPSGLSINSSTGGVTGTISTAGQYSSTITATNNAGSSSKTLNSYVSGANTLVLKAVASTDGYKIGVLRADGFVDEYNQPSGASTWTYYSRSWKVTQQPLVDICVGPVLTLGITNTGAVVAWYNIPDTTYSQDTVNAYIPSSVSSGVVKVQSGPNGFSLALKSNGSLVAWTTAGPYNTSSSDWVVSSTPSSGTFKDISVSSSGMILAVATDGTVEAWGADSGTQIPFLTGVDKVSAGLEGYLALKLDGTIYSWHSWDASWVGYSEKNPVPAIYPAGIGLKYTAVASNYTSFALLNTVYLGNYSSSTVYTTRDVVFHLSKYWCRVTGGSGVAPTIGVATPWAEITTPGGAATGSGIVPWFIKYFDTVSVPNRFTIVGSYGEETPPSAVINVSSFSSGNGVYLAVYDGGKVSSWGRLKNNLPL